MVHLAINSSSAHFRAISGNSAIAVANEAGNLKEYFTIINFCDQSGFQAKRLKSVEISDDSAAGVAENMGIC